MKSTPSAGLLDRKTKSTFGLSAKVIVTIWNRLIAEGHMPEGAVLKYLLWSLSFLKSYETENFYAIAFKTTEKTFRQWIWKLVLALSRLDMVSRSRMIVILLLNTLF